MNPLDTSLEPVVWNGYSPRCFQPIMHCICFRHHGHCNPCGNMEKMLYASWCIIR